MSKEYDFTITKEQNEHNEKMQQWVKDNFEKVEMKDDGIYFDDVKVFQRDQNMKRFLIAKTINAGKENERTEYVVDIEYLCDYLIEKHKFVTWFGIKNDYCFNWNGKIYERKARGLIKSKCEKFLGKYCKKSIVDEIHEKIKRKTSIEKEEFEKNNPNYIPLENGIWDIKNKKLIKHDPRFNFTFIIPQTYDKEAKAEKFLQFIEEVIYPEDIPVMQEWFGFLLYREYFIKKGVIIEGEQDTGKSVLLDTAIKFIGEDNKTGLSLQKITSGSDFTKLSLKNKHANIFDDLSSKDLSDGGAFKVATGGGYISGEEKFGEYSQFRSFAKQMFATNKIPPVKDNDDLAYFGRWIVFKFDNVPEKLDPFLRKKLWTKKEMSGILNWALEGLYRLIDNGEFSYNKKPAEIKQIMERSGCPLVSFSMEVLQQQDGNNISKDEMYKMYSKWCRVEKRPRLSKEMLGRQLEKYCPYILNTKDKERIWKNAEFRLKWRDMEEINQKTLNTDTSDTFKNIM